MGFTQQQIDTATIVQNQAAHDVSPQIRLVAGPGTGKSFSIGERVKWLLDNGVVANKIFAVSFTRAAAEDLQNGILKYCTGIPAASSINVSTLHSLSLNILAKGGELTQYPASPRVIDDWEQRNIFDEELKNNNPFSIKRCGELRLHFEAIWNTGNPPLPFISSPTPTISDAEQSIFESFHSNFTQLYACILPGEAVRKCVDLTNAGILNPRNLLEIDHLIVDEYQDLNNCDVELIDIIANSGVTVLVCGDDDQSIYSFRYAYPTGIQTFPNRHMRAGQHALQLCFRCTPSVLGTASSLLSSNAASSRRAQLKKLQSSMEAVGVMIDIQQKLGLSSNKIIRFVYSMLRILHSPEDYLAYRTLLGLRNGVGISTCVSIANKVLNNSLNFKSQFGAGQTATVFTSREINAINGVVNIINLMAGWDIEDSIGIRAGDIGNILSTNLSQAETNVWTKWASNLPTNMTLRELENILGSRSEKEARNTLMDIYSRLNEPVPQELDPKNRVRIMTLHSSKGLSAKVVFIPGLEEQLIPGPWRAPYPGQIQEAARLLYVGITRARADCIISFSKQRFINGESIAHHPSRFASHLGTTFQQRKQGLNKGEINKILYNCTNL